MGGRSTSGQKCVPAVVHVFNSPHVLFPKDAKAGPQGSVGADAAGVGHAKSGSMTDQLTRQHRMTLDEAHLILNTKRDAELEKVLQVGDSTLLQAFG